MLHVRIEMPLGEFAASSQNTDTSYGAGGWHELSTLVHYGRPSLPAFDVYIAI